MITASMVYTYVAITVSLLHSKFIIYQMKVFCVCIGSAPTYDSNYIESLFACCSTGPLFGRPVKAENPCSLPL